MGEKGRLLDVAASAGLPVPAGAILLNEMYQLFLAEAIISSVDGLITVPDPVLLHETLYEAVRFPRLDGKAAVRAAFSADNVHLEAGSTPFTHRLEVDLADPSQLSNALAGIWSSGLTWGDRILELGGAPRRDLLLMELVAGDVAGRAISHPGDDRDEILVEAEAGTDELSLPRLRAWRNPDPSLPLFLQRMQRLLRGVRRTFGRRELQVDWIDDGRTCWLIQVRASR